MPNRRRKERLAKRGRAQTPKPAGTGKPKAAKKAAAKPAAKPAAKSTKSSSDLVFPSEPGTGGKEEFVTMDNDYCMGGDAPSLDTLDWADEVGDYPKPEAGKPYVILIWAKYHKPGYEFVKRYSMLADQYRNQIGFASAFIDPKKADGVKFIEDPAGKYSTVFPLKIATGHDVGHKVKNAYADLILKALSVPHTFLVSGEGKVVWHQDHGELGATVPQWMHLFEKQMLSFLNTGKVESVGERPESSSEEESSDDGEGGAAVDLDDLF